MPTASDTASSLRWRASRISSRARGGAFDDSDEDSEYLKKMMTGGDDEDEFVVVSPSHKSSSTGGQHNHQRTTSSPGRNLLYNYGRQQFSDDTNSSSVVTVSSFSRKSSNSSQQQYSAVSLRSMTLNLIAATGMACSIYALQVSTVWWVVVSSTCTAISSCCVVWQQAQLRKVGPLRTKFHRTVQHVHVLRQHQERLNRSCAQLDRSVEQVQRVQGELQAYIDTTNNNNNNDNAADAVARLVRTVHELGRVQQQLHVKLGQQVQEQILSAMVLHKTHDDDFRLTAAELERLIRRLKTSLPGVQVNEEQLRSHLVIETTTKTTAAKKGGTSNGSQANKDTTTSASSSTVTLASMVQLLRQVGEDNRRASLKRITATRRGAVFGIHRVEVDDDDDDDGTVFQFHPRLLLKSDALIKLE